MRRGRSFATVDSRHPFYMCSLWAHRLLSRRRFMPLPPRNTSAGRPVVLDTALLPLSFLPSSEKETICDSPCPDDSALHGNAANIAARLAAAKTLQPG